MSGIKIYSALFNAVRVSNKANLVTGPGFFINTVRTFEDFYPAIGDWSSGGYVSVRVNMGQKAFIGDPMGYAPYDTNYTGNNWFGGQATTTGDLLEPYDKKIAFYDKRYSSGKYYYEITFEDNGIAFVGFHDGSVIETSTARTNAVGAGLRTSDSMFTWIGDFNDTTDYTWSSASGIGINAGDTVQVWVDVDNQLLCVKKLDSTMEDYQNYIEA